MNHTALAKLKILSSPYTPPPTHATYDHNFILFKTKFNQSISYEKQLKHFVSSTNGPKITIIKQFEQYFVSSTKGPKLPL